MAGKREKKGGNVSFRGSVKDLIEIEGEILRGDRGKRLREEGQGTSFHQNIFYDGSPRDATNARKRGEVESKEEEN